MPRIFDSKTGTFTFRCVNENVGFHGSEALASMMPADMLTLLHAAKEGSPFVPIPEKGLPVRVYLCLACGYVEMYSSVE